MYKAVFKRLIDFMVALTGLILLSPVFIGVGIVLLLVNKDNPFFYQPRPGKDEKVFKLIKFKSMNDKTDEQGNLLPDEERLTKIGKLLRKTSLDELPQLINVLKGEMSLIGPRPLLVRYLPYYSEREKLRHAVRPGITGLAQVSGRNTLDWDKRLEMDVQYVKHLSFQNDVKIVNKTFKNVFQGKDIEIVPGKLFTTLDNYRKHDY